LRKRWENQIQETDQKRQAQRQPANDAETGRMARYWFASRSIRFAGTVIHYRKTILRAGDGAE
jgi:hypothetical protein